MGLNLSNGIHRHRDHDQDRCATQIEGRIIEPDQGLRHQADQRNIDRPDHRQTREHIVQILCRTLAGPDAGQEAAIFAEVLRRIIGIEHDRGVEEREEDDQARLEDHEQRLTMLKLAYHARNPLRPRRQISGR